MSTQRVPLVAYEDGVRKIIGEAVVDRDGSYIDITAKVTDEEYVKLIQGPLTGLCLGDKETDVESKTSSGQKPRVVPDSRRRKQKKNR